MAKIIKPPTIISKASFAERPSIALFGSIEMGTASDWQTTATELLNPYDIDIYNPRRDSWDSSWEQSIDNPNFKFQVEWELTTLENVGVRLFYFDPATKSPVSMLELGLSPAFGSLDTVVCCPPGFWRKGNIDIVCARYGIHQEKTLENAVFDCISRLNFYHGVPRKVINVPVVPGSISEDAQSGTLEDPLED